MYKRHRSVWVPKILHKWGGGEAICDVNLFPLKISMGMSI